MYGCRGGLEVTHQTAVRVVLGSIPGSCIVDVCFLALLLLCFYLFIYILFVTKIAIPFAMLIHKVYLTYCKLCDRLKTYPYTDLASLIHVSLSRLWYHLK